uniref:Katanin p80 WD40 repeat-containing subunit B1 homolog n=1 Tax=Kalanchoe fedtschenkoi TaxID=63787 RepID=A0A7N0TJB9_KALFE
MAKRGYKLQLVAHSENVNCVSIGKKAGRLFITGGDDHQVRLWSVGKPTSLMGLCGLTSPVESVAFDSAEVLVAAGASSGMIKLWDLEEAKIVRTLTGHKTNCSAVEFHPFGEFFASGSFDTHLKIWDIRKKGCMHTYKGHSQGISIIRFSPDGRWVVSGGCDNSVKVWDLTAGKLLHDFKSHDGHIRAIDFHPLEFLLATGSADKTVKFWDLETFELIGSSRPEATGVRAMSFHPDGRTLFCGLEDSFKVYSWEPIIRHDAVDMGWSSLGDLCIHDGKLLGCSFYSNSVGVWAADISLIQPYRVGNISEQNISESRNVHKQGSEAPSSLRSHVESPDSGTREKTIYVVSYENSEGLKKVGSCNNKVAPSESKECDDLQCKKRSPIVGSHPKNGVHSANRSSVMPNIEPRDSSDEKRMSSSPQESNTTMKSMFGKPLKPAHARNQPNSKPDLGTLPLKEESTLISNTTRGLETATAPKIKPVARGVNRECTEEKNINVVAENLSTPAPVFPEKGGSHLNSTKDSTAVKIVNGVSVVPGRTRSLVEKFERREVQSPSYMTAQLPTDLIPEAESKVAAANPQSQMARKELLQDHISENELSKSQTRGKESDMDLSGNEFSKSRTTEKESSQQHLPGRESLQQLSRRELLQARMFERDSSQVNESEPQISGRDSSSPPAPELLEAQIIEEESSTPEVSESESSTPQVSESESLIPQVAGRDSPQQKVSGNSTKPQLHKRGSPKLRKESPQPRISRRESPHLQLPRKDSSQPQMSGRESSRPHNIRRESPMSQTSRRESSLPHISTRRESSAPQFSRRESSLPHQFRRESLVSQIFRRESSVPQISRRELFQPKRSANFMTQTLISDNVFVKPRSSTKDFSPPQLSEMEWRDARVNEKPHMKRAQSGTDLDRTIRDQDFAQPQIFEREPQALSDENVDEFFMKDHNLFLSTLRARLTKLQVVRHFLERNDIKGAINALKKLPDHSVQADVVSVLAEKLEILNLDLFSCLVPLLAGLLDSAIERHITVSLELLLKLVAVFGPMIFATASAPPSVGVDLHAEERREWCNQCLTQLQKIQEVLPSLIRRGGAVARSAQELNLVLQAS